MVPNIYFTDYLITPVVLQLIPPPPRTTSSSSPLFLLTTCYLFNLQSQLVPEITHVRCRIWNSSIFFLYKLFIIWKVISRCATTCPFFKHLVHGCISMYVIVQRHGHSNQRDLHLKFILRHVPQTIPSSLPNTKSSLNRTAHGRVTLVEVARRGGGRQPHSGW